MKTRRGRGGYEILLVLAVSMVDGGVSWPTPSPSSSSSPSPSSSSSKGGSDSDATGGVAAITDERPAANSAPPSAVPRFFLDSDATMQLALSNVENLPKPWQGPAMFAVGFSQQNMKNFTSTVRSLVRMLISSLVMMAVKRLYFADLRTEADRNAASGLTDALLNVVDLLGF